jgi:hypothetical protein
MYTAAIFCGIAFGFVLCLQDVQAKLSTSPGQVVSHMFSSPANFVTSMMHIILMSVVNRKEIMQLILKLRTIDHILLQGNGSRIYSKTRRRMILELIVIFGGLVPFLCYDSYFFGQLSSGTFEGMSRLSILVSLTTVIQFLWAMRFFRHRLRLLNRKLSAAFYTRTSNTSKHKFTPHNTQPGHSWRAVEEGLIPRDIYDVFKEGNIRTLSVLPMSDTKYPRFRKLQENVSPDPVSYILKLRVTYNLIYEATLLVNSAYGISIILTLMYCFVSTVSNTYFTFLDSFTNFAQLKKGMANVEYYISTHILWVVISVGKTVAISGSCHLVTEESRKLANHLQKLQLYQPMRPDVLLQLQQFSTQLTENTIHFTASGFFSVNLSLLYAFIASSVTYVIILIQFRLN